MEPRAFASLDDILARAVERGEPPFVLVMDSLEDPQNVGTLLRSAEAAGVHGVLFPTRRQAPLSPAAVKASAGAVEHLLLAPVDDLPGALSDLRIRGLRIAAAEADAPLTADQADLRGPLAIIVGSEGQGLSPAVRRRADLAIRIPMRGAIGSLNAAVAGSILLFAAVAQRGSEEGPPREAQAVEIEPPGQSEPEPSVAAEPEPSAAAEPEPLLAEPETSPAEPETSPATDSPADTPAKRPRARKATAVTEPTPTTPPRARKPPAKRPAKAVEPPETPSAEIAEDLLPGPATASPTRPRRARKAAPSDPDLA